jgi:TonB family protein
LPFAPDRLRCLALALACALASSVASAQEAEPARRTENPLVAAPKDQEEPKPATGQLTRPPALLQFAEAVYPKEALEAGITGSVGLVVEIDDKGQVASAQVTEPAGHGFDESALEAVKRFQFSPAEIDGKPAAVRIAYRYQFTIEKEVTPPPPKEAVVTLRGKILQRGNRAPLNAASVAVDDGAFGALGLLGGVLNPCRRRPRPPVRCR